MLLLLVLAFNALDRGEGGCMFAAAEIVPAVPLVPGIIFLIYIFDFIL